MSTKSKEPKETDILLSRVDVALARSQRIIANWLPQKNSDSEKSTGEEKGFREDDAELGRDDSESYERIITAGLQPNTHYTTDSVLAGFPTPQVIRFGKMRLAWII